MAKKKKRDPLDITDITLTKAERAEIHKTAHDIDTRNALRKTYEESYDRDYLMAKAYQEERDLDNTFVQQTRGIQNQFRDLLNQNESFIKKTYGSDTYSDLKHDSDEMQNSVYRKYYSDYMNTSDYKNSSYDQKQSYLESREKDDKKNAFEKFLDYAYNAIIFNYNDINSLDDIDKKFSKFTAAKKELNIDRYYQSQLRGQEAEKLPNKLKKNKDFAKNSQKDENIAKKDNDYFYINANKNDKRIAHARGVISGAGSSSNPALYDMMSKEQIATYNYLYKTQGKKKAKEYLNGLAEGETGQNTTKKVQAQWEKLTRKNPKTMEAIRLLSMAPEGIYSTLGVAAGAAGNKVLENQAYQPSVKTNAVYTTIDKDINDWATGKDSVLAKDIVIGGENYGNLYSNAYKFTDSAARSAIASMMLGGNAMAALSADAAGGKVAQALINIPISMSAYGSSYTQARQNGLSDYDAKKNAFVDAGIEWTTEFLGGFFGKEFNGVVGSANNEALEEMTGDILNLGFNVLDSAMNDRDNDLQIEYEKLIESGKSVKDAVKIMLARHATEEAITYVGTALSMVPNLTRQHISYAQVGNNITKKEGNLAKVFNVAKSLPKDTKTAKLYSKITTKENVTKANIGELYVNAIQDIDDDFSKTDNIKELGDKYGEIMKNANGTLFREVEESFHNNSQRLLRAEAEQKNKKNEAGKAKVSAKSNETVADGAKSDVNGESKAVFEKADNSENKPKIATFAIPVKTSAGNTTIISSVAKNDGEDIEFNTPSGETISIDDVAAYNGTYAKIVNDAVNKTQNNVAMGNAGASLYIQKAIADGIAEKSSGYRTYNDYSHVIYEFGVTGVPFDLVKSQNPKIVNFLTDDVAKEFYNAGVIDRTNNEGNINTPKNNKTLLNAQGGKYINKTGNEALDAFLQRAAEKTHINLVYDNRKESNEGGNFVAKTLTATINENNNTRGDLYSYFHEGVGEVLRALDPEDYKLIVDSVIRYLNEQNVAQTNKDILNYYNTYHKVQSDTTIQDAKEELTNDCIAALFTTDEGLKQFTDWLAEDNETTAEEKKTILEKLKEAFDKLIENFKKFINSENLSESEKATAEMEIKKADELRKTILSALDSAAERASSSTIEEVKGDEIKFNINQNFYKAYDEWDKRKSGFRFKLGTTSKALQTVGIDNKSIWWDASKIIKIKAKHPEMTDKVIKQVPNVIENPMLIMESKTVKSRVTIFGELVDTKGDPVLVILELSPNDSKGNSLDIIKVASAYGKSKNPQGFINSSKILYVNPNKKAVRNWLSVNRLQLPLPSSSYGLIKKLKSTSNISIVNNSRNVNNKSKKSESKEAKNTEDENKTFSLNVPVEEKNDLIAVHNINSDNLLKSLELGGLPSPSIAIVRAQYGHTDFGDISLVFSKDTVDPQNGGNVYSGDAYTPMFPHVEYKLNEKKASTIYSRANKLKGAALYNPVNYHEQNIQERLNRSKDYESFINDEMNDYGLKQLYLYETTGKAVPMQTSVKTTSIGNYKKAFYDFAINDMGQDLVDELKQSPGMKWAKEHREDFKNAYIGWTKSRNSSLSNSEIENQFNKNYSNNVAVMRDVNAIKNYIQNGTTKSETVKDEDATKKKIDSEINNADYKKWADDFFDGISDKAGIRNDKDTFTASGNRRSFEDLHYEYNLENVVRAMMDEDAQGNHAFGGKNMFGSAQKKYSSVSDIKSESDKLFDGTDENAKDEYQKERKDIQSRYNELLRSIPKQVGREDAANDVLCEAVEKYKTKTGMDNYIRRELDGWGNYSPTIVNDLMDIVSELRELPKPYFESKPQRAIGFNEVYTAIIPDNSSKKLTSALDNAGVEYETYKAGDNADRKDKLNSLNDVKFSLNVPLDNKKYSEAVENGDEETAQRYVDSAAMKWGAYSVDGETPLKLYHGTQSFGFTEFDLDRMDDNHSIFLTSDINTATSYSGTNGERKITDKVKITKNNVVDVLNKNAGAFETSTDQNLGYHEISKKAISELRNKVSKDKDSLIDITQKYLADDNTQHFYNIKALLSHLKSNASNATINNELIPMINDTKNSNVALAEFAASKIDLKRVQHNIAILDSWDKAIQYDILDENASGAVIEESNGQPQIMSYGDAIELAESINDYGNYSLYAKFNNPLVVDVSGNRWNRIPVSDELSRKLTTDKQKDNINKINKFIDYIEKHGVVDKSKYTVSDIANNDMTKMKFRNIVFKTLNGNKEAPFTYNEIKNAIEGVKSLQHKADTRTVSELAYEAGYDGVIFKNIVDKGNLNQRSYDQNKPADYVAVAFKPENVKSADAVTYDDQGKVIPLSERFTNDKKDIRYSLNVEPEDMSKRDLIKENKKLREVNEQYKLLSELNNTGAGKHKVNRNSIKKYAVQLKKESKTRMTSNDIAARLTELYDYMSSGNAVWDTVEIMGNALAHEIMDNTENEISPENKQIIEDLKERKISIDDLQRAEIKHSFDSVSNWSNGIRKAISYRKDGTPLDIEWQELSSSYPHIFDPDTTPNDQPIELYEAIQGLFDTSTNEDGFDENEAAQFMTLEFYEKYYEMPEIVTPLDKLYRQLNEERIQNKNKRKLQAVKYNEKLDDVLKEQREKINSVKQEERDRYDKKVKEIKQHYIEMNKNLRDKKNAATIDKLAKQRARYEGKIKARRESAEKQEYRRRIEADAKSMYNQLVKPVKEKGVPDALKKPVLDMLSYINFEHGIIKDNGQPTRHDAEWQDKFNTLASVLDYVRMTQNPETAGNISADIMEKYGDIYIDVPQMLVDSLRGLAEKYHGKANIYDMNAEDLHTLQKCVRTMRHIISKVNELHGDMRNKSVQEVCGKIMNEVHQKKGFKGSTSKIGNTIIDFANFEQSDFFSYIKLLGNSGEELIGDLYNKGFTAQVKHVKEVQDFSKEMFKDMNDEQIDYKKWTGDKAELTEFETSDGYVYMTPAQVMSLYLLNKRGKQSMTHILEGSSVLKYDNPKTRAQLKKKFKERKMPFSWNKEEVHRRHLGYEDVLKIISTLTDEQKAVADKIGKFLSTKVASWGNEVTQELYLYDAYTTENYFPIETPNWVTKTNDSTASTTAGMWAMANPGFSKNTVEHAKTPIYIDDVFDVFARHCNQMINYNAYAIPVSNAMKWINFKTKDGTTMKHTLREKYGNGAVKWFTDFMQDLNGNGEKLTTFEKLANSLMSNTKVASVGANLRVAIQQPTAYIKAYSVMDAKYLNKALAKDVTVKSWAEQAQKAKEYCPIAQWKSWGYFETDVSRGIEDVLIDRSSVIDNIKDKSMILAELGDTATWAKLYIACQLEAQDKQGLKMGTEECYKAAANRLSQIINDTQVVDSVFHRSSLMRRKNIFIKTATAFMSEATKSYNMLRNAAIAYNEGDMTKGQLVKTGAVFVATQIVVSAAAGFIDAFRHKGDDDDKDKNYWQRWLKWSLDNLKDNINPLTFIPGLKDLMSLAEGYNVDRIDMTAISTLLKAANNTYKRLQGNSNRSVMSDVYLYLQGLSQLTGIPVSNLYRSVESIAHMFTEKSMRESYTNSEMYQKLYEAQSTGNKEAYNKWYDKLYKSLKKKNDKLTKEEFDDTIDKKLKGILRDKDIRVAQAAIAYTNKDMDKYISLIEQISKNGFDESIADGAVDSYYNKMKNAKALLDDGETDKYNAYLEDNLIASGIDRATLEKAIKSIPSDNNDDSDKAKMLYKWNDIYEALDRGQNSAYEKMYQNAIDTYVANGASEEEAEDKAKKKLQSHYKKQFIEDEDKRDEIKSTLDSTGLFDDSDYNGWVADSYSNTDKMKEAFENGKGSEYAEERINAKVNNGMARDSAEYGLRTSISNAYKQEYINGDSDTRNEIISYMTDSGVYGNRSDVISYINKHWMK